MRIPTLAIVGVGLIGGSIGLAVRRRGLADRVLGIDAQTDVLHRAVRAGAIDEGAADLQAAYRADLVIFCTPVDQVAEQVLTVAAGCRPALPHPSPAKRTWPPRRANPARSQRPPPRYPDSAHR